MSKIVITIDSPSEAQVKIENRNGVDVDIKYKGAKYRFTTQKDVPLRRMLLDFCQSRGLVYDTTRFSIDCRCRDRVKINENQTADELGIVDGDTIYAAAAGEENTSRIDVHIRHISGKRYRFNAHRDVPLRTILLDFCHRVDRPYHDVRFIFGGRQISDNKTPDDLGLADDNLIDAIDRQRG